MTLFGDSDPAKSNALRQKEFGRLRALPQIASLALTDFVPLNATWSTQFQIPDAKADSGNALNETLARHVLLRGS